MITFCTRDTCALPRSFSYFLYNLGTEDTQVLLWPNPSTFDLDAELFYSLQKLSEPDMDRLDLTQICDSCGFTDNSPIRQVND